MHATGNHNQNVISCGRRVSALVTTQCDVPLDFPIQKKTSFHSLFEASRETLKNLILLELKMWPSVYLNALLVSFALVQAAPWSQPVSYDAHQVIRFPITSPEDGKEIDALALKYSLSVWSSSGAYKDIMISPENAPPQTLMSRPHVTLIQDIQDLIDDETNHSIQKQSLFQKTYNAGPLTEASFFSDYQDYDTITEYMGSLPDAQKVILGQTYEKRDIFGFKFGTGAKSIVFNGGIHAREWISPVSK